MGKHRRSCTLDHRAQLSIINYELRMIPNRTGNGALLGPPGAKAAGLSEQRPLKRPTPPALGHPENWNPQRMGSKQCPTLQSSARRAQGWLYGPAKAGTTNNGVHPLLCRQLAFRILSLGSALASAYADASSRSDFCEASFRAVASAASRLSPCTIGSSTWYERYTITNDHRPCR